MRSSKRLVRGQTALIVILFIIALTLAGTTWHLYTLQGKAEEAAAESLKEQQRKLNEIKDSIQELTQKLSTVKDNLYSQIDKTSALEKNSASFKRSLDDIKGDLQGEIKSEVASIKDENKQSLERSQASLSKIETQLQIYTDQLKKLKEDVQKTYATPVIDVKVDAVAPDAKKATKN